MNAQSSALDVAGLTSGYGEAMVIHDVSFTVPAGEILAILGKNGMGKSTLLKTVMGFLPAARGQVRIYGEDVTNRAPYRIARRAIAYSPQDQAIFQDLTVDENLRLGLGTQTNYAEGLERVSGFFPFLATRRRQRAGTLSGGEQKMLLVARALLSKPRLMLVDEITEGLQPSVIQRLAEVLRSERMVLGMGVLLIEQNVRFAIQVSDRYAVLKRGEIVDSGAATDAEIEGRINEHLTV
jgi:ABC-type branched-subunit amino acid transport system ATPase component